MDDLMIIVVLYVDHGGGIATAGLEQHHQDVVVTVNSVTTSFPRVVVLLRGGGANCNTIRKKKTLLCGVVSVLQRIVLNKSAVFDKQAYTVGNENLPRRPCLSTHVPLYFLFLFYLKQKKFTKR
jgi:hypothetical protein